jgi:zinc transport system substrate-binding protein
MHRIVPFFSVAFLLLALASFSAVNANTKDQPQSQSKLRVLTTIKPIQALLIAIAGDHVESAQLIPDYASPHNYSFKPSDISLIKQADVIFRIDENFEVLLNHAFENKSSNAPIISLADNNSIQLLKIIGKHHHTVKNTREKKKSHDETGGHNAHHKPDTQTDLHIWTSPQNMQILANIIATTLSALDIKNKTLYEKNLARLNTELIKETKEIQTELSSLKRKPYVVFHNSWQYFSHQFGLQTPTTVDFQEGISAGIKSIKSIREKIHDTDIHCVLADPSIKPERVRTVTEGQLVNTGFIDILGANLPLNKNTAITLLKTVSGTMANCLR